VRWGAPGRESDFAASLVVLKKQRGGGKGRKAFTHTALSPSHAQSHDIASL